MNQNYKIQTIFRVQPFRKLASELQDQTVCGELHFSINFRQTLHKSKNPKAGCSGDLLALGQTPRDTAGQLDKLDLEVARESGLVAHRLTSNVLGSLLNEPRVSPE